MVASSDAVVNPDAVMVMLRNTSLANAAVLTSRRFQKRTSAADLAGKEQSPIIWVL